MAAALENVPTYKCIEICPQDVVFTSEDELRCHKEKAKTSTCCPHCRFAFSDQSSYDAHILSVLLSKRKSGQTTNVCFLCRSQYDDFKLMMEHIRHHTMGAGGYMKTKFLHSCGWECGPMSEAVRVRGKTTIAGGYKFSGRSTCRRKEFVQRDLGIIAHEFRCDTKDCAAKLLVPVKQESESIGLTTVRSNKFHNHIPDVSRLLHGTQIILSPAEDRVSYENKIYIKRWTEINSFDYFECGEAGCTAGLFSTTSKEWIASSVHTCVQQSLELEDQVDPFDDIEVMRTEHCLTQRGFNAAMLLRKNPFSDAMMEEMMVEASKTNRVKRAIENLQNILRSLLFAPDSVRMKSRAFHCLYGLQLLINLQKEDSLSPNEELGIRLLACKCIREMRGVAGGVASNVIDNCVRWANETGFVAEAQHFQSLKGKTNILDPPLTVPAYSPETFCTVSMQHSEGHDLVKCCVCDAYARSEFVSRSCEICNSSKYVVM